MRYLQKYTKPEDYTVVLGTYMWDENIKREFPSNYKIINMNNVPNEHYLQMMYLYDKVTKDIAQPNDIVAFLDGDAFPICAGWVDKLKKYMSEYNMACIYRYEDRGYQDVDGYWPAPHLSFSAFNKRIKDIYDLRWELTGDHFAHTIVDKIRNNGLKVKELKRTNVYNAHNVMFGVYDDMIYHNGSGTRGLLGRPIAAYHGAPLNLTRQAYEGSDLTHRMRLWQGREWEEACVDIIKINVGIFDVITNAIKEDKDCNIISRYFLGK
jgi:hypothetical protein